ncbi:uncharacterized protein LOC117182089 [Belonocnema kinseyi]|uniref:uncharacterized protein LOC117182089 n=1 Tax=Belonocnema kinseyi TaxID=2817044 RepID=UPI00143D80E7|nr:uncharacterized protein LOC117182089 [Belonocnema kinseyi]
MRTEIFTLTLTLVTLAKPVELMFGFSKTQVVAVDRPAIQLSGVTHFESSYNRGSIFRIPPGTVRADLQQVVTDKNHEYIIGIIPYHDFCPLMVHKKNHYIPQSEIHNPVHYEKVKVLINGLIANVTVPIPQNDNLNKKFFKPVKPTRIIPALLHR